MRDDYLLVWLDKDLKELHTKLGNYEILKECFERLKKDSNIISINLYKHKECIKNEVGNFFLTKTGGKNK